MLANIYGGHIFKCRVTFLDRWSHCIKYAVQTHHSTLKMIQFSAYYFFQSPVNKALSAFAYDFISSVNAVFVPKFNIKYCFTDAQNINSYQYTDKG